MVHANRAVAVAMAEGPAAGLAILDELREDSQGGRWHLLHACRADLLRRLGRTAEAGDAYRAALARDPPPAEREPPCRALAQNRRMKTEARHGQRGGRHRRPDPQHRGAVRQAAAGMVCGIIEASGLTKHTEVVAMLKSDYGMAHGAAHRVAPAGPAEAASGASATASGRATASPGEAADALYAGKKAPLRPLHDQLMAMVHAMGPDVSLAPKKGYVSLRLRGEAVRDDPAQRGRPYRPGAVSCPGVAGACCWSLPAVSTPCSPTGSG